MNAKNTMTRSYDECTDFEERKLWKHNTYSVDEKQGKYKNSLCKWIEEKGTPRKSSVIELLRTAKDRKLLTTTVSHCSEENIAQRES